MNAILVVLVVLSALGLVAAQHQARKFYSEYEREQTGMHELEVEWGSSSSSKAPGPRMRASKRSPASAWHASTSRWHAGGGRGDEMKRAHGVTFNHNPLLDKGFAGVAATFRAAGAARLFGCAGRTGGLSAGVKDDFLQAKGASRYARVIEMPATRGRIMDRNGDVLAVSTPVKSVWAIPEDARLQPAQARRLAGLLDLDVRELNRKLASEKDFAYLKRQLPRRWRRRLQNSSCRASICSRNTVATIPVVR